MVPQDSNQIRMPVITSSAAEGTQEMLQWFFSVSEEYTDICCGYELDTKTDQLPAAGVHFQPRKHLELVEPFCASLGEAWRAPLYLAAAERLKETWPLSFFGLFRGRPRSPLRVCGYLAREEQDACAKDPDRIENIFHTAGFTAYDQTMVGQVSALLAATPGQADFQFDLYPDGTCGNVFAIDARFDPRPSGEMNTSFAGGENLKLMRLLEAWGITDSRWKQGVETAFTRALPVCLENGETGSFALSLLPQWIKIRWINGRLQPSKLYLLAAAGLV